MKILKKLTKKSILIILAVIVLGVPLLYLSFLNANKARADWYNSSNGGGWGYRKMLTIDRSKVSTTGESDTTKLSNFPVLVSVDDISLKKAQSTGNDILFTDSTGTVKLDHEIESFTQSTGTLRAWVEVPTLLLASDTIIYMYYGNPSASSGQAPTGVWDANTVGVWHMKESSGNITDSTNNGNDSTSVSGSPDYSRSGKIANSINFDSANNEWFNHGDRSSLNLGTGPFTIEAWIQTTQSASGIGILGKLNDSTYANGYTLQNHNGKLLMWINNTGVTTSIISINTGVWIHVVATRNNSNQVQLFVNGNADGTPGTNSGDVSSTGYSFFIANWAASNSNDFNGLIDEVKISNSARSQGWITTEYNNQNSPSTFYKTVGSEEKSKGPVLYLKFDEGTGTTANNSGTQGRTLQGSLGVGTSSPTWTNNDLCVSGKCLQFYGGSNSTVGIGSTTPNIQSVGFWVKPKTTTEPMALLDGGTHNISATGAVISANGFSTPLIYVNGKRSTTLTAGSWQYIEVTTATSFSSGSMRVGTNGSTYLNGFIDEFKVYDYQRTDAEVKADYNSLSSRTGSGIQVGTGPPFLSQGLVGYWKMDESSGNATDSSGNGSTLTNTGTATFSSGKYGNGTALNGTSQYFYASDNTALSVTGDLTLSSWIKPSANTAATQYDIEGKWDGSNTSYLLAQYGDEIRLYLNSASNYVETTNANLSTGTWYHILATYSTKDRSVKIYVNGEEKSTTTTGTIPASITDDASQFFVGADSTSTLSAIPDETAGIDAYIKSDNVTTNYNNTWLMVGNTSRTFIKFDLTSLPDNATVANATFSLYPHTDYSTNSTTYRVYRMRRSWTEASVTWNNYDGTNPWTTAGGFDAADCEQTDIGNRAYTDTETLNTFKDFSLTPTTKAGLDLGYGWLVKADLESSDAYAFSSAAGSSGARPKLVINYTTNGLSSNFFNGSIDEARVYNRALSPKEVRDLYAFAPGPVGYWSFDERSGLSAADKSGNDYTGTVSGATWTNGKYGGALNFAGGTNVVDTIPSISAINTVSFWVNPTSTTANLIDLQTTPGTINISVSSGTISAAGFTAPIYYINGIQTASPTLTANTWTHIAVTTTTAVTGSALRFGRISTTSLTGKMDDVKIYNYARTAKQIVEDMLGGRSLGVGSAVSPKSTVGYWKLDDPSANSGLAAKDSSGNGNDLTLSSSSWTNNGKFSKAWNGTGALWLSRSDDSDFDFLAAEDFSLSLWFKSDSAANPGASEYLVDKGTTVGYSVFADTNGKLNFSVFDGSNTDISTTNSDIYDGNWHHILASKTGTSKIEIYTDGKFDTSDSSIAATGTLVNASSLFIGDKDGVNNGDEFNGDLDEVKVYRYALTSDEVKIEYNKGAALNLSSLGNNSAYAPGAGTQEYCVPGDPSTCSGPVGEWKFDEKTGQTTADTSGNGYTGTLGTGSGVDTSDPVWTTGKINSGLKFDGTNDYISTANFADNPSVLTVSAWVKTTATTQAFIASKLVDLASGAGWAMMYRGDLANKGIELVLQKDGSSYNQFDAACPNINNGQWHYVVAVMNSATSANLYCDGASLTVTTSLTGTVNTTSNGGNVVIGTDQLPEKYFNGSIDQVRIYNYVRTASQIAWEYNKGKPVGWWKFDECTGGSVYDSSGNGNTGTISLSTTGTQTTAIGNGTCTTSASTPWYNGRTGKRNSSLNFDGTNDYVDVVDAGRLTDVGPEMSVALWMKPSINLPGNDCMLGNFAGIGSGGWHLCSIQGLPLYLYASGGVAVSNTTQTYTAGRWYHIVATYKQNTTTGSLYVNGVSLPVTVTSRDIGSSLQDLYIGSTSYSNSLFFHGQLDDVRIYNYALTPLQVKMIMNDGATRFGPSTGTP